MNKIQVEQLAKTKKSLKPTETRVTTADGIQYIEARSEIHSNAKQSFSGRPPNLVLRPPSCSGYVIDDKPDLHVGKVTDHILIGSADAAMDSDLLIKWDVTHVLTVAPMTDYRPPINVKHKCLNILDLPDTELAQYYGSAFAFIDDAVDSSGRVLIHCNAGISRSAAITLAYMMKTFNLSYDSAWSSVKSHRPNINPNIGFIIQLKNYEKQLQHPAKEPVPVISETEDCT